MSKNSKTQIIQISLQDLTLLPNPVDFINNFEFDENIVRTRILANIELPELRELLKKISQSNIGTLLYHNSAELSELYPANHSISLFVEGVSFYLLESILQDFPYELEINQIEWLENNYQIM